MRNTLVIFVDSLSFSYLEKKGHFGQFPVRLPLRPGFGYSVNLHYEMFCGLNPDEAGFLNEWNPIFLPLHQRPWCRGMLFRFQQFSLSIVNRDSHIPSGLKGLFKKERHLFKQDNFPSSCVFSLIQDLKVILGEERVGSRDQRVFARAKQAIASGRSKLFISFPDLDSLAHRYGVTSVEYEGKIRQLEEMVGALTVDFTSSFDDARIFLISDHGICETTQEIRLDLERHFGPAGLDTYLYFVDPTILRVWVFQEEFKRGIEDFLRDCGWGIVLDIPLRQEYNITAPRFGDSIFLLHEGLCFEPNFLSPKPAKAMHGYLPTLESQKGCFLAQGENLESGRMRRMADIYRLLLSLLSQPSR